MRPGFIHNIIVVMHAWPCKSMVDTQYIHYAKNNCLSDYDHHGCCVSSALTL